MKTTEQTYAVGDAVWYAGYEHRVTAVLDEGEGCVVSDRPGAPTAFSGCTHVQFLSPRSVREMEQQQ